MRGLFANKFVLGALVLLALGAQFGLATISHPVVLAAGHQTRLLSQAPVTAAIRACPSPGSPGGGGVAIIASPAGTGPASAGQAVVTRLSAAGSAAAGARWPP